MTKATTKAKPKPKGKTSPQKFDLTTLLLNPDNPRSIDEAGYRKLKRSIGENPNIMRLKPIVYDPDNKNLILAGNMRYRIILDELKMKQVPQEWVKSAEGLTAKEKERFVILDNTHVGEWDIDMLANDWDTEFLFDCNIDIKFPKEDEEPATPVNFQPKNTVKIEFERKGDMTRAKTLIKILEASDVKVETIFLNMLNEEKKKLEK